MITTISFFFTLPFGHKNYPHWYLSYVTIISCVKRLTLSPNQTKLSLTVLYIIGCIFENGLASLVASGFWSIGEIQTSLDFGVLLEIVSTHFYWPTYLGFAKACFFITNVLLTIIISDVNYFQETKQSEISCVELNLNALNLTGKSPWPKMLWFLVAYFNSYTYYPSFSWIPILLCNLSYFAINDVKTIQIF